jgi:Tfp pilus assembly ATPase PilU
MAGMYCMKDLLELLLREGAEELRLEVGEPAVMVLRGEPLAIDVPPLTSENTAELFRSIATEDQMEELRRCGDIHFIYVFQNSARFGVAAAIQRDDFNLKIRNLGR